jgi:hypothetical protein
MGSGTQTDFDPNAFGPFGSLFQTYISSLDNFGRALGVPNALTSDFSPAALSQRTSAPFKAAARCQLELLGLINRRAQAYMHIPTRLAQCRLPQDVVNEQMAFWRTATQQYAETSRKVFDAWTSSDLLQSSNVRPAERDYINFNGTASKESPAPTSRPEQTAGNKQRRVA